MSARKPTQVYNLSEMFDRSMENGLGSKRSKKTRGTPAADASSPPPVLPPTSGAGRRVLRPRKAGLNYKENSEEPDKTNSQEWKSFGGQRGAARAAKVVKSTENEEVLDTPEEPKTPRKPKAKAAVSLSREVSKTSNSSARPGLRVAAARGFNGDTTQTGGKGADASKTRERADARKGIVKREDVEAQTHSIKGGETVGDELAYLGLDDSISDEDIPFDQEKEDEELREASKKRRQGLERMPLRELLAVNMFKSDDEEDPKTPRSGKLKKKSRQMSDRMKNIATFENRFGVDLDQPVFVKGDFDDVVPCNTPKATPKKVRTPRRKPIKAKPARTVERIAQQPRSQTMQGVLRSMARMIDEEDIVETVAKIKTVENPPTCSTPITATLQSRPIEMELSPIRAEPSNKPASPSPSPSPILRRGRPATPDSDESVETPGKRLERKTTDIKFIVKNYIVKEIEKKNGREITLDILEDFYYEAEKLWIAKEKGNEIDVCHEVVPSFDDDEDAYWCADPQIPEGYKPTSNGVKNMLMSEFPDFKIRVEQELREKREAAGQFKK